MRTAFIACILCLVSAASAETVTAGAEVLVTRDLQVTNVIGRHRFFVNKPCAIKISRQQSAYLIEFEIPGYIERKETVPMSAFPLKAGWKSVAPTAERDHNPFKSDHSDETKELTYDGQVLSIRDIDGTRRTTHSFDVPSDLSAVEQLQVIYDDMEDPQDEENLRIICSPQLM